MRVAARRTSFNPSARTISVPTMSFMPISFAATCARTTPATEHSSVTAMAR
jgi:hypothetical protein